MWRAVVLAAGLAFTSAASAAAQELASYQPNSCQKFGPARSDSSAVYARAACVAARAGVTSPGNGALSREEMLSILMLMSLRQANPPHSS